MPTDTKQTVYLPDEFVRRLQQRAAAEGKSSHGVIAAFLRRAVQTAMAEWRKRENSHTAGSPLLPRSAWVEVPAREAAFYENLVKYLESEGSPDVQEWKHGLRRAVAAWGEGRKRS